MNILWRHAKVAIPVRLQPAAWIVAVILIFLISSTANAQLMNYVRRPDPAFRWRHVATRRIDRGRIYSLHFISQVWEGIGWQHQLQIYEPNSVRYPNMTLIWVTGGDASRQTTDAGFKMAEHAGMRVAFLYQVPNQPLFGGKKEDALIAYSFAKYLHTRNASWPLLFPMVKSVIKAMDVIQAFAPQGWGSPANKFIISGASKRGWTTWLTAATGDPRVVAIAPMAIDTLRIPAQLRHQLADYGHVSREINDYVDAGLLKPSVFKAPASRRLWRWVDPYTYRRKLTLPKLIVRGANDPYWTQDALNLYWSHLRGGKWVLYVPNAGHMMAQNGDGHTRMDDTLGAFARHIASSTPMPHPRWRYVREDGRVRLVIHAGHPSESARLWIAHSKNLDFRQSQWTSHPMRQSGSTFVAERPVPLTDNVALFGEVTYSFAGLSYTLSTQVRIVRGRLFRRRVLSAKAR